MPLEQTILLLISASVDAALLLGLAVRGRTRRCLAFSVYMFWVMVSSLTVALAPVRFFQMRYWLAMEALSGVLRYGVAVEMAYHTFKAFPAARRQVRSFFRFMTVATLATPFVFPADLRDVDVLSLVVLPRMYLAAIALFTGLGVLVLWYRLPLDFMHKAILMGLVPYLLVFSLLFNTLREFGLVHREWANLANTSAWIVMTTFLAWAAWQKKHAMAQGVTGSVDPSAA